MGVREPPLWIEPLEDRSRVREARVHVFQIVATEAVQLSPVRPGSEGSECALDGSAHCLAVRR